MVRASTIAIVPTLVRMPGMANLIPLIELAKQLAHRHGFLVTFVIPNDGSQSEALRSLLDSLPPSITCVFLPPVSLNDPTLETTCIESITSSVLSHSIPSLRNELRRLMESTALVALIGDLFGTHVFDVALELNVAPYIFFPSTAMCLSQFLNYPDQGEMTSCDYMPEPPGFITFPRRDLLDPVRDRRNDPNRWVLHHAQRYRQAKGILLNSFDGLEKGAIEYLQLEKPGKPPVYPVGPLVNVAQSSESDGSECLKWLEEQPGGSVLYVSLGRRESFSPEQMQELALGLEMSHQRFLWLLATPDDEAFEHLPEGFLERTEGKGLVVPSWAPQAQVLAHRSTGGFLTHCGWNSTLESVVNGVPLIVWPLYEAQEMNAVLLTQGIGVALRVSPDTQSGLVGRDEIANVVENLMEGLDGKSVRKRMKDLKDAASKAQGKDGCSSKALSEVARRWEAKLTN